MTFFFRGSKKRYEYDLPGMKSDLLFRKTEKMMTFVKIYMAQNFSVSKGLKFLNPSLTRNFVNLCEIFRNYYKFFRN